MNSIITKLQLNNEDYADHIHSKNKQTKQNKKSLAPFFLYSENLTKLKLFCLFVAICESSCFPFFF